MISRVLCTRSLRSFQHLSRASFSGADIREKFSHEITDEGYDYQRQFQAKPATEEKLLQFTSILSAIPVFKSKIFLDLLASNLETKETTAAADYIVPPRIHENGVFVYQARQLATTIRKFRSLEAVLLPGALLTFTYPVFAAMVAVPTYYFLFNAKIYEMSRRLVVRMDILPHLEMISVQRVGAFGVLYTKLHRIQDLEYVPFETVKDNENYLWAIGGHGVDQNLIFKDKSTNEFLYFDRTGIWDA